MFSVQGEAEPVKTKMIAGTNNPDWKFEKQYDYKCLTQEVK